MSDYDPTNPLTRPKTPPKTSWFEFLLDKELLEKHLSSDNPIPTATELLMLFLYQADVAAATAKEINDGEGKTDGQGDNGSHSAIENKKVIALKLLALKVASYLKWDLDDLEHGVPLAMVQAVLAELLGIAYLEDPGPKLHHSVDMTCVSPQAVFALLMYHRWCLRTLVQDVFPTKPTKVASVQVPGLLDPSIASANLKESVMRMVKDTSEDSVLVLEHYLQTPGNVAMPTVQSVGSVEEDFAPLSPAEYHDWDEALCISSDEMLSQVCYDLGCVYFYQQKFDKAYKVFEQANNLHAKTTETKLRPLDVERLTGYYMACCGMLGRTVPNIEAQPQTEQQLVLRVEATKPEGYKGAVDLLEIDNRLRKLSVVYRASLQEEMRVVARPENEQTAVGVFNVVREAIDARLSPSPHLQNLLKHPSTPSLFLKACVSVVDSLSHQQKLNLKFLMRYLCYTLPEESHFVDGIMLEPLCQMFTKQEKQSLRDGTNTDMEVESHPPKLSHSEPRDEQLEIGEMEQQLIVTYDPAQIKILSQKLTSKHGKFQTRQLTNQWRIPRELYNIIDALPVKQPAYVVYAHLLVAKARVCLLLQLFDNARELLMTADTAVKDLSYKLSKLLRWEVLRVDLLQHQATDNVGKIAGTSLAGNRGTQDLVKRCKACISARHVDHEHSPINDLMCLCTTFLLNVHEWDYLVSLSHKSHSGYLEVGQLLAALGQEIPVLKSARKSARDLWDAVVLIFTLSSQQKRSATGNQREINRDNSMGAISQHAFLHFLTKIKEPSLLTCMISILTKIYCILKDSISIEIHSGDIVTLWPTTLGNMTAVNAATVCEALLALMKHALKLQPTHLSWLRTMADIHFAHGQHSLAMKQYLQLGVVATDYFAKPLSKHIYDDTIYKRMIKCCSYLQCHTQVAVLWQYVEDIDYAAVFKALQERNSQDAMDAYYACIWDITLLEFLINLHTKRGELEKRQHVMKLMGQMELNSNNPAEIQVEAARLRKCRFLRTLVHEYL